MFFSGAPPFAFDWPTILQILIILINTALIVIAFLYSPKERINRIFAILILAGNIWTLGLIIFNIEGSIVGSRLAFMGASLLSVFLLIFCSSFPSKIESKIINFFKNFTIIFGLTLAVVSISTNLVAKDVKSFVLMELNYGPLYPVFSSFFLLTILVSLAFLIKQLKLARDINRKQAFFIFFGLLFSVLLGTATNLIMPMITGNSNYSSFGPLGITIFLIAAFYAIVKHGLFNVRIVATEIFVASLSAVLFLEIFSESQPNIIFFRIIIFLMVLFFGIFLVRSVLHEIRAKEKIQKLAHDLEKANIKLKKLDTAKSEFISIASHQLRTPLTVIKGYISMILEGNFGELTDGEKESLNKVFESNERLIQLVENLLNISRIESGRIKFVYKITRLENIVKSVIGELTDNAKKKKLYLHYKTTDAPLPEVKIDGEKIRQVVMNLLDNAIKYTKHGGITVKLRLRENNLRLSVADTGMGIKAEDLPSLFKKFSRGKGTSLVYTEGTGLGLYVAQMMIKAHGGKIWADSDGEGKGSKFVFELPLASRQQ